MRRLVIVGGGSAGWITAAYLNGALNERGKKKRVDITVIESPTIPRITVGEATIPNIVKTLSVIGIKESDFMRATDATFKQSIRFVDWVKKDSSSYHHPFSIIRSEPCDSYGHDWLCSDRSVPFIETVSDQARICEMNLSPKQMVEWNFGPPIQYAYHMNAQKFADLLRDFSTEHGVHHIMANMTEVGMKESGWIDHIELDNGNIVNGDIFVDCTGFRSLLLGGKMEVPYDDFSQWLLCNKAVVVSFSYEDYYPGIVRPYTTATALSSGWVWDIPLRSRRSVGYVYSSDFISDEDAAAELMAYQGVDVGEVETRPIPFYVGQRRQAWKGNCVGIGLAGGFIEPLESTGLYLCDEAAMLLSEFFPFRDDDVESFSSRFNRIMSNRYYEILDFINMHYCLSRRNDTAFWREVQKEERINDRLKAKFNFWKTKEPSRHDFVDQSFFGAKYFQATPDGNTINPPVDSGRLWNYESYKSILYGMGFDGYDPLDIPFSERPVSQAIPFVRERVRHAPKALPLHQEWLKAAFNMHAYDAKKPPAGWT